MDTGATRRYARALYEIAARRKVLDKVAADVDLLHGALGENPRLAGLLGNPQVPDERKKAIFSDLFAARLDPLTLQFCKLLVDKRRVDVLQTLQPEFQRLSDEAGGIVRARVQSAVPLDPAQESRMVQELSRMTGKTVILKASVDPSLRGGAVVWIGDQVIDGSIKGYLAALEARLH